MNRRSARPFPYLSRSFIFLKQQICFLLALAAAFLALPSAAWAEGIPVHHLEGTLHGFLVLSNQQGKVVAVGDLIQVVDADRVTSHLLFHFRDGSIDEETTVFTQHDSFKLVSDHHIQKGPFFHQPIEVSIDVPSGEVTIHSTGKDGKEDVKTEHMDLPSDLCNGLINTVAKNIQSDAAETKVTMLVTTPKPRIITLAFSPIPEAAYTLAGFKRKALGYQIKFELGGIAGVVAPMIGKQPPNLQIWITTGELPTFIRETGPMFEDGPVLTMQLAAPVGPIAYAGTSHPPTHH